MTNQPTDLKENLTKTALIKTGGNTQHSIIRGSCCLTSDSSLQHDERSGAGGVHDWNSPQTKPCFWDYCPPSLQTGKNPFHMMHSLFSNMQQAPQQPRAPQWPHHKKTKLTSFCKRLVSKYVQKSAKWLSCCCCWWWCFQACSLKLKDNTGAIMQTVWRQAAL